MPTVSIIIVNYNGAKFVPDLFNSLKRQTIRDFEVVIVDNASTDKSLFEIQKNQGNLDIKLIKNSYNVGFSNANNIGLKSCNGEYIVFLNNDTYVDDHWLEYLTKRIQSISNLAAVTCKIISPFSDLTEGPMLYDVYGSAIAITGINENFFYGTGAALLVKRSTLKVIGAFDSNLFMYQEDADLCWRIRIAGFRISYEPKAICYHLKHVNNYLKETLKMSCWKFYHAHSKNRIRVLVKNYSFNSLFKILPFTLFIILIRGSFLSLTNKNSQYFIAVLSGFFWNLVNLKDTIRHRYNVQMLRKVPDSEIMKFMIKYSIEIAELKNIFRYVRNPKTIQVCDLGPK